MNSAGRGCARDTITIVNELEWQGEIQSVMTLQKELIRHADIKTTMKVYLAAMAAPTRHDGGETGIRTLGTLSSTHAFQACAFSHSAISPFGKRRSTNSCGANVFSL